MHSGFRPSRRLSRLLLVLASVPLLGVAACSQADYPQSAIHPLGEFARLTDHLFRTTVEWSALVFVLVEGALLYAMFRFRGRPNDAEPPQIHGNTTVEILWTVIPALILATIAVPTVQAIFTTNATPGKGALTVEVVGHQWWWEFRYPEYHITTANELHVPLNRTVSLRMGSGDVVHSFWIPQFAGKRDVFPNRETRLWFIAEQAGEYPGQCAEFCGIEHARMAYRVVASPPAEFEKWIAHMETLKQQPAPAPAPAAAPADSATRTTSAGATAAQLASAHGSAAGSGAAGPGVAAAGAAQDSSAAQGDPLVAQGQKLFLQKGCVGCHSLVAVNAPKGLIGPNLANVGARSWIGAGTLQNTDENLARWIMNPQAIKPGVLMPILGIKPDEAKALVAFLRTHR
ncbi:MAG TPA: cytochrome c oxidase subunit II [Gemmatimonadales bacterium]|nr:cytochrome c oxidase subunit II [Gemmatimonadales bacterium]